MVNQQEAITYLLFDIRDKTKYSEDLIEKLEQGEHIDGFASSKDELKICNKCGAEILAIYKRCPKCGNQ